jgi:hypothetical protein
MIIRLFSIFDPSSAIIRLNNELILLLIIFILPIKIKNTNIKNQAPMKIKNTLIKEINQLITLKKGTRKTFTTLILFILLININSLIPQSFAYTTQPIMTLTLGLIF